MVAMKQGNYQRNGSKYLNNAFHFHIETSSIDLHQECIGLEGRIMSKSIQVSVLKLLCLFRYLLPRKPAFYLI